MKKIVKKIVAALVFFCMMQTQGQTFDFEASKGGWSNGFQMTSADLDVSTGRNTIKCVRENNNATLVLNAATVTIDPTTKNFLKLVVKNESNATEFRIKAQTTNSGDKTMNFTITANDTEFKTYVFDLNTHATWNNATTTTEEINLLFRSGYDVAEGSIFIDEITFYNSSSAINRVLPADNHFYNPTINTSNTAVFPTGDSSTSALQTMIDNLSTSGGGILTINAGTYTLEQVHMKTGVHIRVHPSVIFKSAPQNSLFRAGYDNNFANVNNWSFTSTNGERFTFDFSDFQPTEDIRAFQLGNTTNFRLADFNVLDNYTKFNAVSSGAVGNETTQGSAKFPSFGIIENLDIEKAHYGYGLIQSQVAQNMLFRNLSGEGGVTLRFESGFSGLADRYLTDKTPIINNNYGRNISCRKGAHAVMLSPHTITQGMVDIRDISGVSCEAVVSINFGFLSESKGQEDASGNPINGHSSGTFSEESVIANVSATYGVDAQVRAARLRHVPCALRGHVVLDQKNPDDESYKSPSLAPVYYLALEDYVSLDIPEGRYKVVLDNVTHTGFSSEVRADGVITDGGDHDFEGCDIDDAPIWIKGEDKNTPNPLQTSTMAEVLDVNDFINDESIVIYQQENSKVLMVESNFIGNLKLFNLVGQLVKEVSISNDNTRINVSELNSNIYIIRIDSERNTMTKKIIIE
ncbi:MAG: T9SS type A sorting domain-containing protein [Polaribacter sp.]